MAEVESTAALSEKDIIRAATNSPLLANDKFQLGDRVFPVVDLPYDEYVTFISLLSPLFEAMAGAVTAKYGTDAVPGISLDASKFNPGLLLKLCALALPDLVHIMARQSDPKITVEDVKKLGSKPTTLAVAVIKQITQNGMIRDFADFFVQMVGVMTAQIGKATTKK